MTAALADVDRFAVQCIKADGIRRVEFKRYTARDQAEIDAAGLRRVGIACEIVELALPAVADAVREAEP